MKRTWTKVYRSTIYNKDIMKSLYTFAIWSYLLSAVDDDGTITITKYQIAHAIHIKPSTVYSVLQKLASLKMLQLESNQSSTTITITNWSLYQSKREGEKQTSTKLQLESNPLIQNKKKIISKDIGDNSPKQQKIDKDGNYGNEHINLILISFKQLTGHIPTDSRPRNVAHNFDQLITTFTKKHTASYEAAKGKPLEFEYINQRFWKWFSKLKWSAELQNLSKAKDYLKQYLDKQAEQFEKEVKPYADIIQTTKKEQATTGKEFEREAPRAVRNIPRDSYRESVYALPTLDLNRSNENYEGMGSVLRKSEAN